MTYSRAPSQNCPAILARSALPWRKAANPKPGEVMTSSRRLLYQAFAVVALATFSAVRPDVGQAAAAPAPFGCTSMRCAGPGEDCNDVWGSIDCSTCGQEDSFPVCNWDLWECSNVVYYGCGFAT